MTNENFIEQYMYDMYSDKLFQLEGMICLEKKAGHFENIYTYEELQSKILDLAKTHVEKRIELSSQLH